MSIAEAWLTAYKCGCEVSMRSSPTTVTGENIVFRISHDHNRANPCWMRPPRSINEESSESIARTVVYVQISGLKIKYDRKRLSRCFHEWVSPFPAAAVPRELCLISCCADESVTGIFVSAILVSSILAPHLYALTPSSLIASPTT